MLARQQLFSEQVILGRRPMDAYRFAYDHPDMDDYNAASRASRLSKHPKIIEAIARGKALVAIRSERTGEMIVDYFFEIATADPRELIGLEIGACRFCWGDGFGRQWTPNEYREAVREIESFKRLDPKKEFLMPDIAGGIGFNPTIEPNGGCPECFGRGANYVRAVDTRDLSPQAALLYSGVKQKADGSFEIMMKDQLKAAESFGRSRGVFIDVKRHEGSIAHLHAVTRAVDPHEASQAYQELVKGAAPPLALPAPTDGA